MDKTLATLLELSHQLGSLPTMIQGGGGNISVKNDTALYIKASGTTFKNMTINHGYAVIDRKTQVILGSTATIRPSMELPMHLSLPNITIHTHPVYVNVFNCMVNGTEILHKLFDDLKPLFVTYHTPGQALARAIQEQLKENNNPKVLFLANHGLITCSNNANEALQLTLAINAKLERYLKINLPNFKEFSPVDYKTIIAPTTCLFPDAAVFLNTKNITPGIQEVFAANAYIIDTINKLNKTIKPLSVDEIYQLQNMESEQYRKNIH
ncbi:MAG: class II aldolase/adducin family protein [Patescibacteria group bacterium]|jgi:rhamnose utilization protein RhaD (predicted bifunctional aldolase and dehydrogenase)